MVTGAVNSGMVLISHVSLFLVAQHSSKLALVFKFCKIFFISALFEKVSVLVFITCGFSKEKEGNYFSWAGMFWISFLCIYPMWSPLTQVSSLHI